MKKKKIGIITFHRAVNYGAILQTYALEKFLNEYFDTCVIDYRSKYFENMYYNYFYPLQCETVAKSLKCLIKWTFNIRHQRENYRKMKSFVKFSNKYISKTSIVSSSSELSKISEKFDYIISGSDQIWNMKISNYDKTFLLDFIPKKKSISYAASFGKEKIDDKDKGILNKYIYGYCVYLVRENSGKNLLENEFGINSSVVCDPTLLVKKDEWAKLSETSLLTLKDYILVYLVASPTHLIEESIRCAQLLNLPIIVIGNIKIKYKNTIYFRTASPVDYIYLIQNAKIVYSTSYHGIMFSLIFNVDFIYELNKNKINNNSRIIDILQYLDLESREVLMGNKTILWEKVNCQLDEFITKSENTLLASLKGVF